MSEVKRKYSVRVRLNVYVYDLKLNERQIREVTDRGTVSASSAEEAVAKVVQRIKKSDKWDRPVCIEATASWGLSEAVWEGQDGIPS